MNQNSFLLRPLTPVTNESGSSTDSKESMIFSDNYEEEKLNDDTAKNQIQDLKSKIVRKKSNINSNTE